MKKDKEKKKKKTTEKEKAPKKKRKIKSSVIIIISIIFIILGIVLALIGVGVISFKIDLGPKYYLLSDMVKVGDYVSYDAGKWSEDKEIPNRSAEFTFGGYKKGDSRNDGVTCNNNENKNYGWRVFSNEDGVVTLIQSGISMCYYHGYGANTNDKSLSILTASIEDVNYDYFLDGKFATEAKVLSKDDIDKFNNDDSSYKRIRNDLINIGNPYWLASKSETYYMWYVTEGGTVAVDHVGTYGVRMLITLKKDVKTTGQNNKNVWNLSEEVKKK